MSKYLDIAETLKKEIRNGQYDNTGKLPTEFEMVSRFGVSRQTIRQAISSLKNEGMVTQIQGSGTYVAKPGNSSKKNGTSSRTILVICSYISDYIFPSIIRGVEAELSKQGYKMNLAATGNKVEIERGILCNVLNDSSVEGIIVEGTKTGLPSPNISLFRKIHEHGIPMVFLHCSYPELSDSIVAGMDDYEGGRRAAQMLISGGCKKLGAFFKSDDRQGLLRYAGFVDGILENGLSIDSGLIRWYTTEDMNDSGLRIVSSQIKSFQDANVDCFVCYNDIIAVALLGEYDRQGLAAPRIMSFDNSYLCAAYDKRFYSLGHQKEALGRLAAQKITNMIEGKQEKSVFLDWLD